MKAYSTRRRNRRSARVAWLRLTNTPHIPAVGPYVEDAVSGDPVVAKRQAVKQRGRYVDARFSRGTRDVTVE